MPITARTDKKKALLAYKEKLLQDIKYNQKKIDDFAATVTDKTYFDVDCSSDSEDGFPTSINEIPSVPQLKLQQAMLKTCLQAHNELIRLTMLEYSVNVLVNDPVIEGEPPVTEPGLWREVTAEARFDLVPFNITFYVHKPRKMFAPLSYRGLKVSLLKEPHKMELDSSILKKQRHPSDAIEVLRSYSIAIRSRRNTLARLADKYADNLTMEPLAEGGYLMKCANLLTIAWRLESKKSAIAIFHHRMKFDLEYMEESHIKVISQAHKLLSNPTITTDERTLLLTEIIDTCLEARGMNHEQSESMESDLESIQALVNKHSLGQANEGPAAKKKRDGNSNNERDERNDQTTDEEIMAPPKTIPKKAKPKGKENTDGNRKSVKRPNVEDSNVNVKKAKSDKTVVNNVRQNVNEPVEAQNDAAIEKNKTKNGNNIQNEADTIDVEKDLQKTSGPQKNNSKAPAKGAKNTKKYNDKQDPTAKAIVESEEKVTERNENKIDDASAKVRKATAVLEKSKKKITNKETETHNAASKNQNAEKVGKAETKNVKDLQDKTKEKVAPEQADPQLADKVVPSSKNDLNTKGSVVKKISNKEKVVSKSAENSEGQKVNTDKNVVNSKTALKTVTKKKTTDIETNEHEKSANKDNPVQTDKPTSKSDKNTAKNTKSQQEILKPKGNDKITKKSTENIINAKKAETDKDPEDKNTKSKVNKTTTSQKLNKGVANNELKNANPASTKNAVGKKDDQPKNNPKSLKSKESEHISKKSTENNANVEKSETVTASEKINMKSKVGKKPKSQNLNIDIASDKATAKSNPSENAKKDKNQVKNNPVNVNTQKVANTKNIDKPEKQPTKNIDAENNNAQKTKAITSTKNSDKNALTVKNSLEIPINEPKNLKSNTKNKTTSNEEGNIVEKVFKVKNVATKNKEYIADRIEVKKVATTKNTNTKNAFEKPKNIQNKITLKTHRSSAANKVTRSSLIGNTDKKIKDGNTALNFKTSNIIKENGSGTKTSKIPQMKYSPMSEITLKKNPLRISPRKLPSTFKSSSDSNIRQKLILKPVTGIPRLMNNAVPKVK